MSGSPNRNNANSSTSLLSSPNSPPIEISREDGGSSLEYLESNDTSSGGVATIIERAAATGGDINNSSPIVEKQAENITTATTAAASVASMGSNNDNTTGGPAATASTTTTTAAAKENNTTDNNFTTMMDDAVAALSDFMGIIGDSSPNNPKPTTSSTPTSPNRPNSNSNGGTAAGVVVVGGGEEEISTAVALAPMSAPKEEHTIDMLTGLILSDDECEEEDLEDNFDTVGEEEEQLLLDKEGEGLLLDKDGEGEGAEDGGEFVMSYSTKLFLREDSDELVDMKHQQQHVGGGGGGIFRGVETTLPPPPTTTKATSMGEEEEDEVRNSNSDEHYHQILSTDEEEEQGRGDVREDSLLDPSLEHGISHPLDVPYHSRKGRRGGGVNSRQGEGKGVGHSTEEEKKGGGDTTGSGSNIMSEESNTSSSSQLDASSGGASNSLPHHHYPPPSTTSIKDDDNEEEGEEESLNSDMMELQRGVPFSAMPGGDGGGGGTVSVNSDNLELRHGLPMNATRRTTVDSSSDGGMMNLQPGVPMGGEVSMNSDMMDLQHGLAMSQRSESPEEEEGNYHNRPSANSPIRRRDEAIHTMVEALSLHHEYSTPQGIVIDTNKPPEIPDTYPSLMDAVQSGSSLIPTIATQSIGITMPMHHQPLYNGREYIDEVGEGVLEDKDSHEEEDDDEEEEGREDSLTYTQFYQHQVADEVVEATPLRSSSHSPSPDTLSGAPHGAQQILTTLHPPAFSAGLDPRMAIDYERRYIVDLERINEEGTNASRSGFSGGNPSAIPAAEEGVNNKMQSQNQVQQHQQHQQQLHQQQQQQHIGQFQVTTAQAINLHQQQQYHPLAPAPHPQQQQQQPNNQFYNYRHQYYQEQYLDDNETAQTSKYDDDTNSTCSSVTLSQAFQSSDVDSCSSYDGLNSTVSSITFSQVDQHEHAQQGYYIATKLGDFVHKVPNEVDVHDDEQTYGDGDTTVQEPENANNLKTPEDEKDAPTANDTTTTHDTTTAAAETTDVDESEKNDKQVGTTTEDMAADLIAAIVPECGVPIPSVMAKVGSTRRRKSSNTGLLLPWHSSRSIQNYHRKKGGRQQQQPANNSLFSISSVHTFRG